MERVRKDLAILLNNVWHSALIDFGYVNFIILLIKLFSRVQVHVIMGYDTSESDCEERDRFWIE